MPPESPRPGVGGCLWQTDGAPPGWVCGCCLPSSSSAALGQAVPLYTDWLWYGEVGFTQVFTTVLSLRGWLLLGAGGAVFLFMYGNLWLAARTAAPDVLWELDDQLGLPGRAVLEPLIRRLLLPVIAVIALLSGLRAGASWDMVLGYVNATPFGVTDPLFGRDLAFFVFELPLWRFLYGGAMTLVIGTLLLSVATYVLLRSLVLTAQGPRLAAGARIASPRARRRAAAPARGGILARPLRAPLLAARRGLRRLVHRRARDASRAGRRSRRWPCSARPRACSRSPGPAGAFSWRASSSLASCGLEASASGRHCSSASRSPPTSSWPSGRTSSTTSA